MVEAIHSTYSYTFSCVYTAYVGGHIIKWVNKYIGFYGCQDLNAHRTYICIKSFRLHNHIIESNIVEQKANFDLLLQYMNIILTYMTKRYLNSEYLPYYIDIFDLQKILSIMYVILFIFLVVNQPLLLYLVKLYQEHYICLSYLLTCERRVFRV